MSEQKYSRLEEFISLAWYEAFLRFIANFIAKSSEILLTAGLVVSSANFLSDGSMLKDGTPFAIAWAWTQAIAIDGSLGVSFYSVFQSLKQRDWIKLFLYSILTMLLTLVAWFITEGDIFSHAVNTSSHEAIQLIGIDVRLLSTLRAIAVVGFVLMSRLHDVPLLEQSQKGEKQQKTTKSTDKTIELAQDKCQTTPQEGMAPQFTQDDLERLLEAALQKHYDNRTVVKEEGISNVTLAITPLPALPEKINNRDIHQDSHQENLGIEQKPKSQSKIQDSLQHAEVISKQEDETVTETFLEEDDMASAGQEDRLLKAYQDIKEEGQRMSGRLLAQRARVRRSTCLEWLRAYEEKQQGQNHKQSHKQNTEPLTQITSRADTVLTIEQEN
ncbi:hypothetical protein [Dictyobacter vulcani]|uniref:hypothetical protein n=1 Tax=Dictyobacter vulcani TaxID=2607529 RepID=UPI00125082B3|nr:hypothetical protein [Dictyobacter vulcani]